MTRLIDTNLKRFKRILASINALDYREKVSSDILERASLLRQQVRSSCQSDKEYAPIPDRVYRQIIPEAFALVRAVVKQEFGWTVFENQMLAAMAMLEGRIVELDTGEGKTLAAVFVAFIQSLTGRGVHVLTFNDYLARRDAAWMGPLYLRLGVSVAAIGQTMDLEQRRQAYLADVTYVTAKEAGFDYLRRFLAVRPEDLIQRPFSCAIVDEADSILIDEARIPLVLAGGDESLGTLDPALFRLVAVMRPGQHFNLDEHSQHVLLTESGVDWLEKRLGLENLYDPAHVDRLTQIRLILQAVHLLRRDVDYIVRDGRVDLVDEFTGRVIQDRQWPEGLHEAVEIKEGLSGHARGRMLNRITLHDFIAQYPVLCGMTGTAASASAELMQFYHLAVTRIPPHLPCRRIDQPDRIYTRRVDKEAAILAEITQRHQTGQPILLGTASVEESERLATQAHSQGLVCEVLNARHDDLEAEIIARAGQEGAITISTNMAGRGVDIRLGEPHGRGLYVIGTCRHRSLRIDRQLRGRAGRQGDPGESCFFISLQDELIEQYQIRSVLPPEYQNVPDHADGPILDRRVQEAVDHTQRVVEGQLFQQREALTRYSRLVDEQRSLIYKLHQGILTGEKVMTVWQNSQDERVAACLERLARAVSQSGRADDGQSLDRPASGPQAPRSAGKYQLPPVLQQAQQQAAAILLGQSWSEYLEWVDQLLDHVSLMRTGPNDPYTTFNRQIIDAYEHLLDTLEKDLLELCLQLKVVDGQINLAAAGLMMPPSTRTYLIDDGGDVLDQAYGVSMLVAAAMNPSLALLALAARKWQQREKRS